MTETNPIELPRELTEWISNATGATPLRARRTFGGGSRHTWFVDAQLPDGPILPLVLRLEGEGAHAGTSFSLEREFIAYRALEGRGIPVPKAYGLLNGGSALLLERLEGTAEFRKMPASARAGAAQNFMTALAQLHSIEVRELTLPGFEVPRSATEHATIELDRWQALARTSCWDEPLVRYAFSHLRVRAPRHVQRTVLVQGDTGPGNFMALHERVTGLIDWEFAHVGDPMDDFGWLRYRSGAYGAYWDLFAAHFPAYEKHSGIRIDEQAVAYYFRFAILRCVVTVALAIQRGGALGVIPYRLAWVSYLRQLADLLVADAKLDLARDPLPAAAADGSSLYAEALYELRTHVLAAVQSSRGKVATHAAISALARLELKEKYGAELEAIDRAERDSIFGSGPQESLSEQADRAGASGDTRVLAYLARRAWREQLLWPPARTA